jgi:hypothetical protein
VKKEMLSAVGSLEGFLEEKALNLSLLRVPTVGTKSQC